MIKKVIHIACIHTAAMLLLGISSCSTVKVEKPTESYLPDVIRTSPSVIGFTTEARISDIQREVNKQFTGLVYEDNSLEDNGGDNLMVKAWKQGEISLNMTNNILSYRVPLKIWIKAGFKVDKFGISLSDYRELNGALALKFRTAVTLNPDWNLTTKTESDGYEWLTDPVVKVGGLNIPVKFVADLILQSNLKSMGNTIDESVKDYFDLKTTALEAWRTLNQPVCLNEEYNVWLKIQPEGFYASPVTASGGMIRHRSGVKSVIESYIGQKPAVLPSAPLPKLQISNDIDDKVIINTSVDIPFNEINTQVKKYLAGQTFTEGRRSVRVEDIEIYGSDGKLVAATTLSGSFRGTIYFKGVPAFRAQDSTLVLNDFDFDLSTRNVLIKSAAWIYQGGFRNMVAKQMVWPLAKDLKALQTELNNNLRSYRIAEGVTLSGQVNRLAIGRILITPEGVKPFLGAEGRIKLMFSSGAN